ncbi:glycosyltransferase family 35 protein [Atractiella rhizophila]|nr:glycosyltransferase family 35 protein [Atractiella rhizophila]
MSSPASSTKPLPKPNRPIVRRKSSLSIPSVDPSANLGSINALAPHPSTVTHKRAHVRTPTGFIPNKGQKLEELFPGDGAAWKDALGGTKNEFAKDTKTIEKSVVRHVQTTLARAPYNLDVLGAYQAVALSVRDRLIYRFVLPLSMIVSSDPALNWPLDGTRPSFTTPNSSLRECTTSPSSS